MRRSISSVLKCVVMGICAAVAQLAQADFEVTAPDGRRIRLKENGTWTYVQGKEKEIASTSKRQGELLLSLEGKETRGSNCRFTIQLSNNTPFQVRSLVLQYSAYKPNNVVYDTVTAGRRFNLLKPGDRQSTQVDFSGVTCEDIVRVQVGGGDRCEIDELHRYSDVKGECLERLRVVESKLVRFDK
jgi:hypothetical protein